jgi:serine/threonine protein phosphatase 1
MREPDAYSNWLDYGGLATLGSYGVVTDRADTPKAVNQMAHELTVNTPEHHLAFLDRLEPCRLLGDYLFVHAGIRPGIPIQDQSAHDLLWIRKDFLKFTKSHPHFIVHGHQICDEPEIRHNRIGIDTGAFATGRLCCLVLDGEEREFIDTR